MAGLSDPLRFIKAEEYFGKFSNASAASALVSVQSSQSVDPKDPLRYGALLTFSDGSTSLFQFVTPQLWRIRVDPAAKQALDYSDANTRTIVQNSFAGLVDQLQTEIRRQRAWNAPNPGTNSYWATTFEELPNQSGWLLSSVQYLAKGTDSQSGKVEVKAYFRKSPFHIQCTRLLDPHGTASTGIQGQQAEKIIWQTSPGRTFLRSPEAPILTNIVLNVDKPGPAEYVGFGEQGGKKLVKSPTVMNYFCYDNLGYSKVYNQGPLDDREPLYHSQPFFMELNGTPGYRNVSATLVDNYSQVFIDLGKSNSGRLSLGIRFGGLDVYVIAADRMPQLIWLFTSIVGRPQLKPRFVLGHHQGGYGYESRRQLEDVVSKYHGAGIPLDGLHIDVDFQHKYRTFTVDESPDKFPNVDQMFANFRSQGVKCCTNITPIISFDGYRDSQDPYPTITAAWDTDNHADPSKNFLIMDRRYEEGLTDKRAEVTRYLHYDGGQGLEIYANDYSQRQEFNNGIDRYEFVTNFNSGYPFHGGVSYGSKLGIAGFYPDLNRQVVREQFWAKQYEDLFNKGLEFVWQDMTTPAVGDCYGDMLGFPGRLLVSSDPYEQQPDVLPPQKTAMELWALYSYNLHKATFQALQNLPARGDKRNFIIGRGSSTGMHRYAGLWTGDNRSTWDFWRIAVAEVLACGLGGLTIIGVDMGGFFPDLSNGLWCDPDLFIRWYSGSFLLPWYRNHYMGKQGQTSKLFQEVYMFGIFQQLYPQYHVPDDQQDLYASVVPICKYYVRLRYSLIQALYDRMFENIITGLPIARSMLITDPDDTSLFNESAEFVGTQYLLGHYILVCPIFSPDNDTDGSRDVYLPRPDNWYSFNLRIDGGSSAFGVPLSPYVEGGSVFSFNARISSDTEHFPYITPIYVREGAIIPQITPRLVVGDGQPNPINLHVYPGRDNWYSMFLDDGVSRTSAPGWLATDPRGGDVKAKGFYREVRIQQQTSGNVRTVSLTNRWNQYDPTKDIGNTYTIVLWIQAQKNGDGSLVPLKPSPSVTFTDKSGAAVNGCLSSYRGDIGASILTVPISLPQDGLFIRHSAG